MHILIIRFSSLGDIVLNSSLMTHLRKNHGDKVKISLLTSSMFAPLYENHPDLDHVWGFSRSSGLKGLKELFHFVSKINHDHPIDLMIDLHGTLRSIALKFRFMNIPCITIDKRTFERSLLTTFKINLLSFQGNKIFKKISTPHRYGELLLARTVNDFLGVLGLKQVEKEKESRLSSVTFTTLEPESFKLENYSLSPKKYICIVPSASFPEKRWPIDSFKKLLEIALNLKQFETYKFVILAGPADQFCDEFNFLKEKFSERLINLQGKTDFVQTTLITKHAYFCVGNDTGVPHIAESVGTSSLFILGPTGEEFGFYPHLENSRAIMKRLWCRPCTTNGKGNCIRSERFCLTTITPEEVIKEMLDLDQRLKK